MKTPVRGRLRTPFISDCGRPALALRRALRFSRNRDNLFHHPCGKLSLAINPAGSFPWRGFQKQAAERSRHTRPAACFVVLSHLCAMASLLLGYRSARAFRRRSSHQAAGRHSRRLSTQNGGPAYRRMELPPEYWHERAERLRKTADFVDDQTRETLLRIAGNYEARSRRPQTKTPTTVGGRGKRRGSAVV